jgi:uncharacterized RDD family membrane protein YckC
MDGVGPSLREQGMQALRDGEIDRAVDLLARCVISDGQDAEAQALLGVAYSQKGLHAQATRALETAIELRPQEVRYLYNLGVALEQAGDPNGAANAYGRVLQLNPEHAQARAKLQALGGRVAPAPTAAAPAGAPVADRHAPWQAGSAGSMAPPADGPPGTVQCGQCKQWSKPGLSCEWCSAPLRSAASASTAPWLQSSGNSPVVDRGPVVSMAPDMGAGEAFGRRFAALFIDNVFIAGLAGVMIFVYRLPVYWCYAVNIGYEAGMLALWGRTLGKMALGVRVVGPDGGNPSLWRAFLRQIVSNTLSEAIICLGYLWMLWDENQQTWHDKIAGTTVERA